MILYQLQLYLFLLSLKFKNRLLLYDSKVEESSDEKDYLLPDVLQPEINSLFNFNQGEIKSVCLTDDFYPRERKNNPSQSSGGEPMSFFLNYSRIFI